MASLHTHYDNLKVTRNAPPEVIRAAYKTLSQKYHPDRHPGNAEATRIMAIINTSYDVLSDPAKRKKHDEWIALQETTASAARVPKNGAKTKGRAAAQEQPGTSGREPSRPSAEGAAASKSRGNVEGSDKPATSAWIVIYVGLVLGLLAAAFATADRSKSSQIAINPAPPTDYASKARIKASYSKPDSAPNGFPWPPYADYVDGYESLRNGGLSRVTVDNSNNDSDVFGKLVALDNGDPYPVRFFFIPARSSFVIANVAPGRYDIRYRDLTSGRLSRSEGFRLQETMTDEGTRYSTLTMTLYRVRNGNMKTYGISEADF